METIKWIVTPPCRECDGPSEYMKRFPCIGCEKFFRKKTLPVIHTQHRLTKAERQLRNGQIYDMRQAGLSYGRIAMLLNLPRATVQSAVAAVNGKKQIR